jgi:hypothetical protein
MFYMHLAWGLSLDATGHSRAETTPKPGIHVAERFRR